MGKGGGEGRRREGEREWNGDEARRSVGERDVDRRAGEEVGMERARKGERRDLAEERDEERGEGHGQVRPRGTKENSGTSLHLPGRV